MATCPATGTAECRQHPSAVLPFVGLPGASVAWIRSVACTGIPPRASVLTRDKLDRKQGGPQDAPLYRVSGPRLFVPLLSMRIAPARFLGFLPALSVSTAGRAALVNLVNKSSPLFHARDERPRPRRASYLKLSRASPSSPSPFFLLLHRRPDIVTLVSSSRHSRVGISCLELAAVAST